VVGLGKGGLARTPYHAHDIVEVFGETESMRQNRWPICGCVVDHMKLRSITQPWSKLLLGNAKGNIVLLVQRWWEGRDLRENLLDLSKVRKSRVDLLERLVDLLADFRASQDYLPADEDQKDNLRFDHAVDEAGEELRLVGAEVVMPRCKTFETNREPDVAGADNVLDLEVCELGIEAELLDDSGVFARCKLRIVLRLCTSDDHLAGGEDERGSLWVTDTHDDGGESLWIVLSVASVECDRLQVESTVEIDSCDDVLQCRHNTTS